MPSGLSPNQQYALTLAALLGSCEVYPSFSQGLNYFFLRWPQPVLVSIREGAGWDAAPHTEPCAAEGPRLCQEGALGLSMGTANCERQ